MMASQPFKLTDGTEAGDLMIENERLKTSINILNGKLKTQEDTQGIINRLKDKNKQLEIDNQDLSTQITKLKSNVSAL
jgi:hypothetical protein